MYYNFTIEAFSLAVELEGVWLGPALLLDADYEL